MEGTEDNSVQNHPIHEEHQLEDHHHQQDQLGLGLGLGLGFQHSLPPPPNPDPNLESSSPPDDLDHQSVNEELPNQQSINGELRNQQSINGELQNLALEDKDVIHTDDEEREGSERNADHDNENEGDDENYRSEELQNQQSINGELQNLALEEKDVIHTDNEEREGSEIYADHENENEGFNRDGDEDSKDQSDMGDDKNYRSENEEGFEGNENVGGDSLAMEVPIDGKYRRYHYPVRPDAEDCSFYIRTGTCKFGSNCKFNHPPKKRNQAAKEKVKEKEENPERPGQTECKYYLRSGGCKFGKACRYNHSRGRTPVAPILELNFLGLPIRSGEKECPYYMRNGSCKYGSSCRFNHPDPTTVGGGDPMGYINGRSVTSQGASQSTMSSWSSPRTAKETAPFVPMMFSPPHGVPSASTEWNGYQAPVYPVPEGSLPTPPAFAMNIPPMETNFYNTHHQQQMVVEEFPERPGQPECSFFMKTGDCKYRSGCKFHHPKHRSSKAPPFALSDKGLPLRPDQNVCTHYSRYGICKFGPACRFDHPVNFVLSASSGVSGPDHPPPFGNPVRARMAGSENGSEPLIQQPV